MVSAIHRRVAMATAATIWLLAAPGCVRQPDYDANKAAAIRRQAEQLPRGEKQVAQLQADLDAAKKEAKKVAQANSDLEAKIKSLQQENAQLKDERKNQAIKPSGPNEETSQLQKDLDAARADIEKAKREAEKARLESDAAKREMGQAQQAKQEMEAKLKLLEQENTALKGRRKKGPGAIENLSGTWEVTFRGNMQPATLEALGSNNYRLGPANLGLSGIYRFDGTTLSLIAQNPSHPGLVWSMTAPGLFEMVAGDYKGASMRKKAVGGADAGAAKP